VSHKFPVGRNIVIRWKEGDAGLGISRGDSQ
jgi:hypothetical protein